MGFPRPSLNEHLAAQLGSLSQFFMSDSEAAEAVRNLVGFIRLLADSDRNETEKDNEHADNRSGHRIREAKARTDRDRQRRAR